jgi:DNA repair exonuclease SbcCD nuclease subunit
VKIVHAADLHLDSPLRGLERYTGAPAHRVRDATRRAFENLIGLCIDEEAKLLCLAGDLWDGEWRDYSTGLFFAAQMTRLREAGISVVWIRGNHDAQSRVTRHVKLPENVRELSTKKAESVELSEIGVVVHGQGFASRDVRDNLARAYPAAQRDLVNVGLLHTSVDGRPGHDPYAPCSVTDLVALGYDYWALGHVHRREILHRDPWLVFPGNLQGRHVKEQGDKGASIIHVESGRVSEVEHRALDVVRWAVCSVDASECRSGDDVVERVEAELRRELLSAESRLLAARIQVLGASAAHADLVKREAELTESIRALAIDVGSEDLWIEKVRFETSPVLALSELLARDDAFGQVLRGLEEIRGSDAALLDLGRELAELTRKLPVAVRPVDFDDPAEIRALCEDAARELVPRLVDSGDME